METLLNILPKRRKINDTNNNNNNNKRNHKQKKPLRFSRNLTTIGMRKEKENKSIALRKRQLKSRICRNHEWLKKNRIPGRKSIERYTIVRIRAKKKKGTKSSFNKNILTKKTDTVA